MVNAQVTIVDASWLAERNAGGQPDFGDATVWYFGEDHRLYTSLHRSLGENVRWGDTGGRLNEVCTANQRALIDIEQAFHIFDRDWWECRNIAERGPYSTDFTPDCCRYLLFCDLLADAGSHVFIVEAVDLGDLLIAAARSQRANVRRLGPGRLRRWSGDCRKRARAAAGFVLAAWRRWRRVGALASRRRTRPVPVKKLAACDVLFAAWTRGGDFPKSAPRDLAHSMGLLPKLFRDQGLRVGFIALPLDEVSDPAAIAETVVRSDDAAILPDDTVTGGRVLADCLRTLFPGAAPIAGACIGGHPIDGLCRMVLAREQFDWRAANARLWSRIGPYLAALGCRPKAVFHVYENQTWEKALRQGLRRALPDCRVIGCHQSPLSDLYLSMLPARSERPPAHWPTVVLSHGPRGVRQLTDAGAPAEAVANAGLFRQGAFLRSRQPNRPEHAIRRAVCATGPGYQECLELARKSAEAVRGRDDFVLVINFHPITTASFRDGIRRFLEDCGALGPNVTFSDSPINGLFDDGIDAVLYADTNSGFEAASSGARAVNVLRDHALCFDKLPDGLARRVRSVEDLRRALDEIGDDDKWPSEEFIGSALADCFAEMNLDVIMTAAGLERAAACIKEPTSNEAATP